MNTVLLLLLIGMLGVSAYFVIDALDRVVEALRDIRGVLEGTRFRA